MQPGVAAALYENQELGPKIRIDICVPEKVPSRPQKIHKAIADQFAKSIEQETNIN